MGYFSYTVADGMGQEATARTEVAVTAINDAPVLSNTFNQRPARWEDLDLSHPTNTNDYQTPAGAFYGLPVEDATGIVVYGDSVFPTAPGVVGFRDGAMFWGTGLSFAQNGTEKEDSNWSLFEKSSKCIGMLEWIVSLGERIDIWTDHFHAAEPRSVTIDAPSMEIGIER
jgi:hypothetical protein